MICRLCRRIGAAKGLCMPHYMAAYRRKRPRKTSTRGDFQTGRAKPRLTHADRPGSAAGGKVVVSHDGPPGAVLGYEFTGSRKDGEK